MSDLRTQDGTAYEITGPEGAPVLSLIHGLGLSRVIWEQFIPMFSQSYRVLSYDLYGHGDSAPLDGTASLATFSNQLASLLDHLGVETSHVIGFSIGGMINRRFAIDHASHVSSLVILNSPHDRGEEGQILVEERASKVREQGALSTMDAALERWFTPAFREARPDMLQLVRDLRVKADPESYAQTTWVLAAGVKELIRPDPPVAKPTLVMTCENDSGSTPAMSHTIASEIDGAKTSIVPQLQHLGLMEQPELFSDPILAFLEGIQQ